MQWIADKLFIGNKLSTGQLRASDGTRIDLRNVTSPIIVFCSWGDDITPPQQALGWITDLYDHEKRDRRRRSDHRLHDARLDRSPRDLRLRARWPQGAPEFAQLHGDDRPLPPGLYEAVITEEASGSEPGLVETASTSSGWRSARSRTSGKLGVNPPEDERRFATVARVSEVNKSLYRTFAAPVVRSRLSEAGGQGRPAAPPQPAAVLAPLRPQPPPPAGEDAGGFGAHRAGRRSRRTIPCSRWSGPRPRGSPPALDGWGAMRGQASGGDLPRRLRAPRRPGPGRLQPRNERPPARRARPLPRDCPGAEPMRSSGRATRAGASSRRWRRALVYIRLPEGSDRRARLLRC